MYWGSCSLPINDLCSSSGCRTCLNVGDEAPVPDGGFKPTFTERPVTRQSDDGSSIMIECRVVGDPKPTIMW